MIRNSKTYSIEVDKIEEDIAISVSLEMKISPELAELVLRDLRTDIKDFSEARILAEIVRDPGVLYSLCQRIEEVKNQSASYQRGTNQEVIDWNLHTANSQDLA
ncbi:hypothetical protein [Lyngbya aestuarii]|uniref:hypothetical protein n=1 Tax=Lyngbya aestuarii TaxID=118322 RepID=UPI00403D949C